MNVSVICPVFNTVPALLHLAARSVLDQVGSHALELIIVDDVSTDAATLAMLKAIAASDSRVRVVYMDKNAGPGQARMVGIAHSTYNWIGFIDSDDLWPDGKLNQADAALREQPGTRWLSGSYTTLGPDQIQRPSVSLAQMISVHPEGRIVHRLHAPDLTRALIGEWLPLGASLVSKELIAAAGGFDARLIYGEDWLLNLRLSILAPMDYSEVGTYVLRRQGTSMMRSPGRMSAKLAKSGYVAWRDPLLHMVRRELRWWRYRTYKDIAMNNALNGNKLIGLSFAARALLIDPRAIKDLLLFMRFLPANGPTLSMGLRRYSTAEQVVLSQLNSGVELERPALEHSTKH